MNRPLFAVAAGLVGIVLIGTASVPQASAKQVAGAAQLPEDGSATFAQLGIGELIFESIGLERAAEVSAQIQMDPTVVRSASLHYISALDYEIDWGSSPPGSILLSTNVDGFTNTQLAIEYDGTNTIADSIDRVAGLNIEETSEAQVVAASAQNYFRTASQTEEPARFTIRAEFFDGAAPRTIRVLATSRFTVTSVPVDPVALNVEDVVVSDPSEDGIIDIRIDYQVRRHPDRPLNELFVSLGTNHHDVQVVGDQIHEFTSPSEVSNGTYMVEAPAGLGLVELAIAAETEYNSPARRIAVETSRAEPRQSVAGIPIWLWSLIGSLLVVLPLTRAVVRRLT